MEIVEYSSNRAEEIANLFYSSVHAIDSSIYSEAQKDVWAPTPIDYGRWNLLLNNDQVAGFIELESDGHIDCAYVSPEFQKQGVATALLKHITCVAQDLGIKQMYVEASIVAIPLFEKFGFSVQCENKINLNGIVLINYTMCKRL